MKNQAMKFQSDLGTAIVAAQLVPAEAARYQLNVRAPQLYADFAGGDARTGASIIQKRKARKERL